MERYYNSYVIYKNEKTSTNFFLYQVKEEKVKLAIMENITPSHENKEII